MRYLETNTDHIGGKRKNLFIAATITIIITSAMSFMELQNNS